MSSLKRVNVVLKHRKITSALNRLGFLQIGMAMGGQSDGNIPALSKATGKQFIIHSSFSTTI